MPNNKKRVRLLSMSRREAAEQMYNTIDEILHEAESMNDLARRLPSEWHADLVRVGRNYQTAVARRPWQFPVRVKWRGWRAQ